MDREQIYNSWLSEIHLGEKFCNLQTIARCRQISDRNFCFFYEYIEYLKSTGTSSTKTIRSAILKFLTSPEIRDFDIETISHDTVASYFLRLLSEKDIEAEHKSADQRTKADKTYNANLSYIKTFLGFFPNTKHLQKDLDVLRISDDECAVKETNLSRPLSAQQVSKCREMYRGDIRKLYIFEMFYRTDITRTALRKLKYDKFDFDSNTIAISAKTHISFPDDIKDTIISAHNYGVFDEPLEVDKIVEQMKTDLEAIDFQNFKPSDATCTRKQRYMQCPQCSNYYEGTAQNWCAVRFTKSGDYWIVCKKCGEEYGHE